jgi:hypothetical protein
MDVTAGSAGYVWGYRAGPGDVEDVVTEVRPSTDPVDPAPSSPAGADASGVAPSVAELDSLVARDLGEHPEVYQRIHAELQTALAAIDDA